MLLEDLFDVKNIDEDGKKFDNISRISALSQTYNLELTLDVNTEIYPIKVRWCASLPAVLLTCTRGHARLALRAMLLIARLRSFAAGRALLAGAVHKPAQGW